MPPTKISPKRRAPTASWLDIVWRAVHQLSVIYTGRDHFHYYQDICRYIETHWHRLAPGKDRTSTWTNTVSSTITTHKRIFKPGPDQGFWGLRIHPDDETPDEVLDEIRQEMLEENREGFEVAPQQYRRKRKTGWGESKAKRQRARPAPRRTFRQSSESEESDSESSTEDSSPIRNPRSFQKPAHLPVSQLPPIFNTQEKDEEEYVDIEGVSEEEPVTPAGEFYSFTEYVPESLSASFEEEPSLSMVADAFITPSVLFAPPEQIVAGEEWFQSLFQ